MTEETIDRNTWTSTNGMVPRPVEYERNVINERSRRPFHPVHSKPPIVIQRLLFS